MEAHEAIIETKTYIFQETELCYIGNKNILNLAGVENNYQ